MAERIERRYAPMDVRMADDGEDGPRLVGYAAVFDSLSGDLGGFQERIQAGAFRDSLGADVRALWNHNADYPLGRTRAGTLRLAEDGHGLAIEIAPPDTQYARDFLEAIRRGDVDQMSFAFSVPDGGDAWERTPGGVIRTLKRVKLFEVSPVIFPAYEATSIQARSMMNAPDVPAGLRVDSQQPATADERAATQARLARRRRLLEIERLR